MIDYGRIDDVNASSGFNVETGSAECVADHRLVRLFC